MQDDGHASLALESSIACVPVTALQVLESANLLISGCGPYLRVHNAKTGALLLKKRTFADRTIHGICCHTVKPNGIDLGSTRSSILAWAANSFVCITLWTDDVANAENIPRLELITEQEVEVEDWILCGNFLNSGSSHPDTAYLLTAHNSLFQVHHPKAEGKLCSAEPVLLGSGPTSVLYSATVKPVNANHILIGSGTVFGEVVLWSCVRNGRQDPWSIRIHRTFTGHKGSVFGVDISDMVEIGPMKRRLLVSCSDDRSIRLWDITEDSTSAEAPTIHKRIGESKTVTKFITDKLRGEYCEVAMTWGHLSRIWGVQFLNYPHENHHELRLISHGEDATSQIWILALDGVEGNSMNMPHLLRNEHIYHGHSGKNIWSLAILDTAQTHEMFTGGADGSVTKKEILKAHRANASPAHPYTSIAFRAIFDLCEVDGEKLPPASSENVLKSRSIKEYAFLSQDYVLVTTDNGHVLEGQLSGDFQQVTWKKFIIGGVPSPTILSKNDKSGLVVVGTKDGRAIVVAKPGRVEHSLRLEGQISSILVAWTKLDVSATVMEACIVCVQTGNTQVQVVWLAFESTAAYSTTTLELPPHFITTSARYDPDSEALILGSRAGAIAFYRSFECQGEYHGNVECFRHVHGSDTVTSIMFLNDSSIPYEQLGDLQKAHILTTGRDGMCFIHILTGLGHAENLTFKTIHASSPPFGPNIEGAYLARGLRGGQAGDLFLYGFRSTQFVLWNESQQIEVTSVECGGAHRNWAFSPQLQYGRSGGCFAWTKAGTSNFYHSSQANHQVIQRGGHGREIKAVAVSSVPYSDSSRGIKEAWLIATGAEDTTIRLFAIWEACTSLNDRFQMRCIRILKKHTTGLQSLAFSSCGRFLFSGAGCNEFYVWGLTNNIPHVGVGVVLDAALPKSAEDSDARIMSFDVIEEPGGSSVLTNITSLLITTAHSNGKVKLMRYSHRLGDLQGSFETLRDIIEGEYCLTQARLLPSNNHQISTILSASTNGSIVIHAGRPTSSDQGFNDAYTSNHRIHQNSILATSVTTLDNSTVVIATGGDDNALALTLISRHVQDRDLTNTSEPAFATLIIPKAHAAAVTAVATVVMQRADNKTELLVTSAGNDQRVKLWRVCVRKGAGASSSSTDAIEIEKVAEAWTSVADAGATEILGTQGEYFVLIVGVGIEILRFPVN